MTPIWSASRPPTYALKAGDIGGIATGGFFGKAIRWKKKDEGPEKTTHVWRVVRDGVFPAQPGFQEALIVEALVTKGVTPPTPMSSRYGDKLDKIWVARPVNLTEEEVAEVVRWTLDQVGKRYSLGMIWKHLWGNEEDIDGKLSAICSWLVAMADRVKLLKFWGLKAEMADPQDIERFISNHLFKIHIWIKPPPWKPGLVV